LYLLGTVASGSGTELRVSALPLGQRTEYRVAALAHRRILSCAVFHLMANTPTTISVSDMVPAVDTESVKSLSKTLPVARPAGATI
jgi:hypothetical protein